MYKIWFNLVILLSFFSAYCYVTVVMVKCIMTIPDSMIEHHMAFILEGKAHKHMKVI